MMKILLAITVAALASTGLTQQMNTPCAEYKENHFKTGYAPLAVSKIQGRGVVEVSGKILPGETVPNACLLLFTAEDNTFVSSTKSDAEGRFHFDNIPRAGTS